MTHATPQAWHYAAGQWTEGADPIGEAWGESESEKAVLARLGYEEIHAIGHQGIGTVVEIWARDEAPRHVVCLSAESSYRTFYADALPDAMDLLARWVPIVRDEAIITLLEDVAGVEQGPLGTIETIARRAAWGTRERYELPRHQRP